MGKHTRTATFHPTLVGLAIAAVGAAVITWTVGWGPADDADVAAHPVPGSGATETAVVSGTGPVTVEMWFDVDCTDCATLYNRTGRALADQVSENRITLTHHPVTLREESLPRAASVACAAEHGFHPEYLTVLLEPSGPGPAPITADALVHLAGTTGAVDPGFAQCVRANRYLGWARQVSAAAASSDLTSLPAVRVNGADVPVTTDRVKRSVAAITDAVIGAAATTADA